MGTVFKLTPQGSEAILYSFTGGHDGAGPVNSVLMDADGNIFGTTAGGGDQGSGTVFRIAPDGTETVLYAFKGGSDGKDPESELIADQDGNLYGTTAIGGANNLGTVFKMAPDGTETVVYSFKGGSDGSFPWGSGLWRDANGNLYGTTFQGSGSNGGVVFKISPAGIETILHSFSGHDDGAGSTSTLVPDGKGNLYGTAAYGGTGSCSRVRAAA